MNIGTKIKRTLAPWVKDTKYEDCENCEELAKLLDQEEYKEAARFQWRRMWAYLFGGKKG